MPLSPSGISSTERRCAAAKGQWLVSIPPSIVSSQGTDDCRSIKTDWRQLHAHPLRVSF